MRIKYLIAAAALALLAASSPATAQGTAKSKAVLQAEINSSFPNNTTGAITPAIVRGVFNDFVASWQQYASVNAQTGTSYTVLASDYGQLVTFSNSSAIAVTLPQPTGTFLVFNTYIFNQGGSNITVTPANGATINGAASLVISPTAAYWFVSDQTGLNYKALGVNIPAAISACNYSSFNAAIAALGSTPVTLLVNCNLNLTASTTVPATMEVLFQNPNVITQTGAFTIAFNGPVVAPPAQLFSGFSAGQISFASGSAYEFPVDWWGASTAASAATNRVAFNSAVQAHWNRGVVTVGAGTFSLCGTGSQSASNGAAIINNQVINPSLYPTYIKGKGRSLTILQASASCNYNVIESVNTANTQIILPVTLEDLTISGLSTSNVQQAAGDRYQNGAYFQNSGPVVLRNVNFTNASYHGFNANAVTDLTLLGVRTHDNCSDGMLLNGNVGASLYGLRAVGDLQTFNNGRSDCGTKLDFVNAGAIVFQQYGANLRITSSGHTTHQAPNGANPYSGGGLITSYLFDSKIDLTSNGDRTAWYPDALTQNNVLTIVCRSAVNYCVDDTNGTAGAANAIAGNTIVANFSQSALSFHLGAATGLWSRNTISGYALDTTAGGTTQIFVLGPNYTGNNLVTGFTAGNVLTSSTLDNMFKFSSATVGSANYYNNVYAVGTFTGSLFSGQDSTDVICGVKGYTTASSACATFLNLGPAVGALSGIASIAQGDLLYGSASNVFSALAKSASASQYLKNSGTSNNPAWASVGASDLSGLGTGVATALAVNVGSAGAIVVQNGALGTPSSGTATNLTGLPISTGLTGAGTGVLTALGVNVGSAGAFVTFNGALGTPSSGTLTNATGLPTTGLTGTLQAAQEPAHTGDVTNTAGSLALTLATTQSSAHTWAATNTFTSPAIMQNTGEAARIEGTNGFLSFYTTGAGARVGYIQVTAAQITMAADSTNTFVFNVGGSDRWRFDNAGKIVALGATNTVVLKQGANGSVGTFICTGGGTITITNSNVAATDGIIISLNTAGGTITTPPAMKVMTASTSFQVLCGATDTSTYNYAIIKNAAWLLNRDLNPANDNNPVGLRQAA